MFFLFNKIKEKILVRFRNFYYGKLLGSVGSNIKVWGKIKIEGNPKNIHAGNNLSLNHGTLIEAGDTVLIGDNVTFSSYCQLHTSMLDIHNGNLKKHIRGKIEIGNNVWFASNVIISPGVKIGNEIVVGANSFINRDLESGYIYAGSPVRKIKKYENNSDSNS